jgi:hypothetical protein
MENPADAQAVDNAVTPEPGGPVISKSSASKILSLSKNQCNLQVDFCVFENLLKSQKDLRDSNQSMYHHQLQNQDEPLSRLIQNVIFSLQDLKNQ